MVLNLITPFRVTILVNNSCRSTKIDQMSINSPSAEILTIRVETGNESFTVFGVYRRPLSSVSSFGDILGNILHARTTPNNSIIMGDFNIDSLSNSLTQDEDEEFVVDLLKFLSYLPLISIPTRVTHSTANCIDHIYFNSFSMCKFGVVNVAITDHFPIFLSIAARNNSLNQPFIKKFRDMSGDNYCANFRKDLNDSLRCFSSFNLFNIDDRFRIFSNMIYDSFNKCCPIKSKAISQKRFSLPMADRLLTEVY